LLFEKENQIQTNNQLLFLGSGTSTGIPMITCTCAVCTSLDPKDQRLRQSIYLHTKIGKKILIDTTPDMRTQFLRSQLRQLDFCFITHDHADHLHGIDDVRAFCFGPPAREVEIYVLECHKDLIENRFPYIFHRHKVFGPGNSYLGGGLPLLNLRPLTPGRHNIHGEEFTLFELPHGRGKTMGIFHHGMAYMIDCHEIPDSVVAELKGKTDLLIIDCLQRGPHATHMNVEQCFKSIQKIAPKRAYLTHMNHDLSHQWLQQHAEQQLGPHVQPAYDLCQVTY